MFVMKSIFRRMCVVAFALTTIFTMSSFTSQDEDKIDFGSLIREATEEINAECPQVLSEDITMTGARITNQRMVYDFTVATEIVKSFAKMKSRDEQAANKMMLESMIGDDKSVFFFLACAEAGYGVEFCFASSDGRKVSLGLSSAELEKFLNEKYSEEDLMNIVSAVFASQM
jgi:hypothetical protein